MTDLPESAAQTPIGPPNNGAAPPTRRIVVTGGTGFVGKVLCERLTARFPGVTLVVPTRRLANAQSVQMLPGVELRQADVHDPVQAAAVLAGADTLVHLVAILHGSDAAFERVHIQLPRTLAHAAREADVQRVVHVSALGVSESAPSAYLRSKAGGEAVWRRSGLPVALLRPSVVFGADDRFTNLFVGLQRLFPLMPLAGAHARMQPVWVGDVAEAIVRTLDRGPADDPVLECAGPEVLTLGQIVQLAGTMAGCRRPVLPLPEGIGMLQAAMMSLLPGEPPLSRDNLLSLRVPNVASGQHPGLQSLGIVPQALSSLARHFAPRPAYRDY